jgi:hypothetical protein
MTDSAANVNNDVKLNPEDIELLREMRKEKEEKKKKQEEELRRKERLDAYIKDPKNGDVYQEIYNSHVKAMIEKYPSILNSDNDLKNAFHEGHQEYKRRLQQGNSDSDEGDSSKNDGPAEPGGTNGNDKPDDEDEKWKDKDVLKKASPEEVRKNYDKIPHLSSSDKLFMNVMNGG